MCMYKYKSWEDKRKDIHMYIQNEKQHIIIINFTIHLSNQSLNSTAV